MSGAFVLAPHKVHPCATDSMFYRFFDLTHCERQGNGTEGFGILQAGVIKGSF